MQGGLDSVSSWVVSILDPLGWRGIWSPLHLPYPMNDYVFRPVSVFLVKMGFWLSGNSLAFPAWVIGCKAFLVMCIFSMGSWYWLREQTSEWNTSFLICLSLLLDSSVFTAYNFTEFDGLGAGLILFAHWTLQKQKWKFFGLFVFLGLFLKESTAICLVLFLVPQLYFDYKKTNHFHSGFYILFGCLLLWGIGASSIIFGHVQSSAGNLDIWSRIPIVGYTWWQILTLCTETGAMLLIGHMLLQYNRWLGLIAMISFLLWGMQFHLTVVNHYQTFYFSEPFYVSILVLGVLVVLAFDIKKHNPHKTNANLFALQLLGTMVVFSSIILISSNLREDLASRLFLVFLPGFLLHIFQITKDLFHQTFGVAAILYIAHIWSIVFSGWNMMGSILFERSQEDLFYETTAQKLKTPAILLFSETDRPLLERNMKKFGGQPSNTIQVGRIDYFPSIPELPYVLPGWNIPLTQSFRNGTPTYFWHRYSQVQLSHRELLWLHSDFSWMRGEEIQGAHAPISINHTPIPQHSQIEDLYFQQYPIQKSNLDIILEKHFQNIILQQQGYRTVSPRLIEYPLRWWNEISIIEPRKFQQELWIRIK